MTASRVSVRAARPDEADALTDLALAAKAVWGYDEAFMEACRAELTVTTQELERDSTYVALLYDDLAGFYALTRLTDDDVELAYLFVQPAMHRQGIGRALMDHARSIAVYRGFTSLVIVGDPHAEPFYLSVGAVPAGTTPSDSIPNRRLPVFRLDLMKGPWYHGSPAELTYLTTGSMVTPFINVAKAFSHKPSLLTMSDEIGAVKHNGQTPGFLYVLDYDTADGDLVELQDTEKTHWQTQRELPVRRIGAVPITDPPQLTGHDLRRAQQTHEDQGDGFHISTDEGPHDNRAVCPRGICPLSNG